MAKYKCTICDYIFDEEQEKKKWEELPDNWECPVCGAPKTEFVKLEDKKE